ncbi:MAG: T9SS type A sorting domain-containing protein [Bacteroidota bacterium]|nr:T9SS type A sorting domain-containing protein [Bacteroidota bacterium]
MRNLLLIVLFVAFLAQSFAQITPQWMTSFYVEIFPNPASDFIKIQNASKLEAIYVYNPQGVLVLMNNTNANYTNYELDISYLNPGNYYILGRGRNGIVFADEIIVY